MSHAELPGSPDESQEYIPNEELEAAFQQAQRAAAELLQIDQVAEPVVIPSLVMASLQYYQLADHPAYIPYFGDDKEVQSEELEPLTVSQFALNYLDERDAEIPLTQVTTTEIYKIGRLMHLRLAGLLGVCERYPDDPAVQELKHAVRTCMAIEYATEPISYIDPTVYDTRANIVSLTYGSLSIPLIRRGGAIAELSLGSIPLETISKADPAIPIHLGIIHPETQSLAEEIITRKQNSNITLVRFPEAAPATLFQNGNVESFILKGSADMDTPSLTTLLEVAAEKLPDQGQIVLVNTLSESDTRRPETRLARDLLEELSFKVAQDKLVMGADSWGLPYRLHIQVLHRISSVPTPPTTVLAA